MRNLDPQRAKWIRLRMGLLCGVMGVGLGGIVSTAYRVQVEDGKAWRAEAEKQRQRRFQVDAKRGGIYDRNRMPLAVSIDVPSVSADVAEMVRSTDGKSENAFLDDASRRIADALSLDPVAIAKKLAGKPRFVWLKRRISDEEVTKVRLLSDTKKNPKALHGLYMKGDSRRFYPGRDLAGTVLGFVAPDGFGKDGLELSMDEELRGHAEEIKGLRDRGGRLIFSEGTNDEKSMQGHDVQLTIDGGIQYVVERELEAAQRTYETKGGSLVVVDPNTGEILAMASTPGYNPNDYSDSDVDARRDRAVSDRFEPGSVMKVFTVASALAAGTLKANDTIYCERGSYRLGPVTIHDTHVSEWLSVTQLLAKSSNIGALKVGLNLGEPGLYAGLKRFGFGESTGLPLPGEASGVLRPRGRPWVEIETANAAFGQGISVTTVQLAMAFAAIANGGKLLEPLLVQKVTDGRGRIVREGTTRVRREAVPAHVARVVADMLTAVTEDGGTGLEAAVPGFRVAGKTATAQKVDPNTGRYAADRFTSSFVGFVPADRPRLVIAVVLDDPTIGHYGGDLAGPVFRRVAESSLRYLGVGGSQSHGKLAQVRRDGDVADTTIASMKPLPTSEGAAESSSSSPLAASGFVAQSSFVGPAGQRVPDVAGLGMRDAVRVITTSGFSPQLEGWGRLVRQMPAPGTSLAKGATVRLIFELGT